MKNTSCCFELTVIGVLFLVALCIVVGAVVVSPGVHIGPFHADVRGWRVMICAAGDLVCQGNPFGFPTPGTSGLP